MLTSPRDAVRRAVGAATGRLHSLPILALMAHSTCNCRCVMCDIWKANADRRDIDASTLDSHMAAIRKLHVRRVMLTGGEPLLHRNLWALCERLLEQRIRISLVTTGLTLERHAEAVARFCDEVVVSIDGPPDVHDEVRRVPGAHARIARGLEALAARPGPRQVVARSVVQRLNAAVVDETIGSVARLAVDRLSFLAADLATRAFNRPVPWDVERRSEVQMDWEQTQRLAAAIARAHDRHDDLFDHGFVVGGEPALWRIHQRAMAELGLGAYPRVRCNAPWVSAVLETDGQLRPCFFHAPYSTTGRPLDEIVNSPSAIAFRRGLDVSTNDTCRRCVCSIVLPIHRSK